MKKMLKKVLILLILITIITGIISSAASDVRDSANDTNKTSATLNSKNKLSYKYRDIGKYNNLYCVQHSQSLDSVAKKKGGITFNGTAMVDIVGNTATFYKLKNDKWVQNGDPVVNSHNNLLAGILTEEKPNDIITAKEMKKLVEDCGETYKSSTHKIYKGYGGITTSGTIHYAITQIALWYEWNTWIDAVGAKEKGFCKDSSNSKATGVLKWKKTVAKEYKKQLAAEISSTGKIYSTQIYMLDTGLDNTQNLIIVEPKLNIPVTKVWKDNSNTSNRTEITVKLLANGKDTGKTLKLNSDNNWYGIFKKLDKKDSKGNAIKYTVEEVSVTGYTSKIEGDQTTGFTITNKLKTTSISVTKKWYDDNDADKIRPTSITVKLYENDKPTNITATLNAENNWTYTFTNLPEYKKGKKITYTVKEDPIPDGYEQIVENGSNDFKITNVHEVVPDGYVEITGTVWHDGQVGKANNINGKFESGELGIEGIKVILKDKDGNPIKSIYTDKNGNFTRTDYALTKADGTYTIRVNYDNSNSVYKLYENADVVAAKLKTAYVEFEYDTNKYTTVTTAATGTDTSKAKESEATRNAFDKKYGTVTPSTDANAWLNEKITASTQEIISFETYKDKTAEKRAEVTRYCSGNGKHIRTNPDGAWLDIKTENNDSINHKDTCSNKEHVLKTQDLDVEIIENVNLGLFSIEQPDVAIFSDLSKVKVTMQGQEYTYLYGVRSNEKNNVGLKVKFEQKGTYTYKRPVNPADIAYINKTNNNLMSVEVTYEISLANLSTTLPVTIHNIDNYYDSRYTLTTEGWNQTIGTDFNTAKYNGDLNITLQPGAESPKIQLTYTVSLEAIKGLLNENATLNNAVEIQSYSTKYGVDTLYAEQQTGGRTNTPYGGYDKDSHPGNANIALKEDSNGVKRLYSTDANGKVISAKDLEDDTDIAPSFLLCKDNDYYKILSGNVWEDSDANPNDNYRLGDGKKADTDKNVENVKVELYKVKEDGTMEIAKLYYLNTDTAEIKEKDAITYTDKNGNYAFGDGKYGVVTDKYVIKFTYGDGIEGSTINARNYKSTIISSENINMYDLFKGTNINEEWHLNTTKGYSIAVDSIEERAAISDLQYSNFKDKINISAWSKVFDLQIEFDPSESKTTSVDENGKTTWKNELNIFDFGIIERAREDIFVETTAEYVKITLANGQVLLEGDPRTDELNYTKIIGFKQNIDSGTAARNALDKQLLIEMDIELLQGAQLEVKYGLKVTNNSEKDIEYYIEGATPQYKTEYYYFGTNNEGSPEINTSVNYVVDYLDGELTYTWENANDWTQKTADELLNGGFISEPTYNAIKENEYVTYITTKFNNLKPGETMTDHIIAKKLLANQEENVYDNHAEILKIDDKTARTHKQTGIAKEYKMGNYVPSLATRQINTDINLERAGLHEQDDDRIKIVITPPTGEINYITTYVITGTIGLIVIAIIVIFIKKKLVNK